MTALGGGDVAASFALDLVDGTRVFAKTHPDPPPKFFLTEANGLRWLAEAAAVNVPRVLAASDEPPVLVLSWIPDATTGPGAPSDEAGFGRALAMLHQMGAPCFGRQDRATTGSRGLPNEPCRRWSEFYATNRLLPLARLAADSGALPPATIEAIEAVAGKLGSFVGAEEQPARLHGDLWAGNRLLDGEGQSWLIDPACHGGHREFDLAMMRLFGGFGSKAFAAYDELHPLADGASERVLLHQLAPLAVHAIKFGGPYVAATTEAAFRYL